MAYGISFVILSALFVMLISYKSVAANETVRVSFEGTMLVPGETTLETVKALFNLENAEGRRSYYILKDGEAAAKVRFNKKGILKDVTLCNEFLGGFLKKECAPNWSSFADDLSSMEIIDGNTLLTGSRTPEYSEMSIKKGGVKVSWNYDLFRKNGKLEGKVTSVLYHDSDGFWYILVSY